MEPKHLFYSGNTSAILAFADTWHAKGQHVAQATSDSPGLTVLENGRRMLKAGTIWPSNGADAEGVVLQDYDMTDGDRNVALVIAGDLLAARCHDTPSAAAIAALPRIKFHGAFTGYAVTFTAGSNGTLAATVDGVAITSGALVYPGKTVVLTATPASNYQVDSWTGSGTASGDNNKTYTLAVGEGAETVSVSFKSAA
jgi:hypothetical protein